ncbi:MAG: fasciclin domain-containing protein [Anaerolineales bacterium]|nr:MAG: fasciclin domain-containing protein [Anaerolineales bacterium]
MKLRSLFLMISGLLVLVNPTPSVALAHQPYCENADLTASDPWQVPDATISYAYFGNLYPEPDVDYFTFEASGGQEVLLSLSIPAIDGQENFAPAMAVFGPGLDTDMLSALPERVTVPKGQGGMLVPLGDEPEYWYEPFGKRYYWNWENYFFKAPEDAAYTVVLWHPEQQLGRYSFVIGSEEIFGGDQECMASMDAYWTPLVAGENPYRDTVIAADAHTHADGTMHDHSDLLEASAGPAPFVDLQVIPLDDGGYNVRVQTLNFTFAPHHVGREPAAGEGHAHLYIDGVKIARIYGEWYHLESLPEDAEMITVGLYANNHQPLAIDGVKITDTVMIADIMAMEPTIVDIAVADDRFESFVAALAAADLVDTLQGEGPFTVFAPTDEAFEALPEGTLDALLEDKVALTDLLLYHVIPGKVLAADGVILDEAGTLQGERVAVTVEGDKVKVNESQIIIPDIEGSNGVIHGVDAVLIPKGK